MGRKSGNLPRAHLNRSGVISGHFMGTGMTYELPTCTVASRERELLYSLPYRVLFLIVTTCGKALKVFFDGTGGNFSLQGPSLVGFICSDVMQDGVSQNGSDNKKWSMWNKRGNSTISKATLELAPSRFILWCQAYAIR